ncbi:extracellular solute-binding protein [Micrococcales bacterium 31B]|nr:extracellular solute-binding protein [Micrococcales bacterium 31B]
MFTVNRRQLFKGFGAAAALGATGSLLASCSSGSGGNQVEMLQSKPEKATNDFYRAQIAKFNEANPGVTAILNNPANFNAIVRTRLVKDTPPSFYSMVGDTNYKELTRAGVVIDLSTDPLIENASQAAVDLLNSVGRSSPTAINGLPYAFNAVGVNYNKQIFEDAGVQPPKTWDEYLQLLETLKGWGVGKAKQYNPNAKSDDITPLSWGFKDAWTMSHAYGSIISNRAPKDWYEQCVNGSMTLKDALTESMELFFKIGEYGPSNAFSNGYNELVNNFAGGEAAMYNLGSYSLPQVHAVIDDPNAPYTFEVGSFATPAAAEADTIMTSQVDVNFAIATGLSETETANTKKFIDFLYAPDSLAAYCTSQYAIPCRADVDAVAPDLEGQLPYFKENRLNLFAEQMFPASVPWQALVQNCVQKKDIPGFITTLEDSWKLALEREKVKEIR